MYPTARKRLDLAVQPAAYDVKPLMPGAPGHRNALVGRLTDRYVLAAPDIRGFAFAPSGRVSQLASSVAEPRKAELRMQRGRSLCAAARCRHKPGDLAQSGACASRVCGNDPFFTCRG